MVGWLRRGPEAASLADPPERLRPDRSARRSREWPDQEPFRVARGVVAGLTIAAVFWTLLGLALWWWLG